MNQMKDMKKKQLYTKKMTAFVFILILALFSFLNLVNGDKEFSERENRILEQKPKMTWSELESGRFMEHYETYLSDQFMGRNFWVSVKTNIEYLAGKRESGGVFKGKDRYLLEDIAVPDEEQLSNNLDAIREFAASYPKSPTYVMLVPNAANVLSDKLPSFAVTEDQSGQLGEIRKALGDTVTWVDAEKVMKKHKSEDIYYRTDHHWTTLGAYYAFQELAKVMKLDTENTPKLTPYAVTGEFNGTLSSTSGYETGYREPIYIYTTKKTADQVEVVVNDVDRQKKTATLYDSSKLDEKDKYALFLGGNTGLLDIRTTADKTDRLLLIKDSYANCFVPFLTAYYREIFVVDPRYYTGDIHEIMEEKKITSVLFLYNGNTFIGDNSLDGVLKSNEAE